MTKTALQLIQHGWTQCASARDTLGVKVNINSDKAVCWCAAGAIAAVYRDGPDYYPALTRLQKVIGSGIASWNDKPGRTKKEVIEAFVKAGI